MSEENVEVVRRAYEAFNREDLGSVLEVFDVDMQWNASDIFFDQPRTYHGRRAASALTAPRLLRAAAFAHPAGILLAGEPGPSVGRGRWARVRGLGCEGFTCFG
jgi:ketosteroid isomerase-like protein